MAGCLTIVVIIIMLALIFNFPLATIGLVLGIGAIVWGANELKINKELGAKSRKPTLITIIGIMIVVGGFSAQAASGDDVNDDTAQTTPKTENSTVENDVSNNSNELIDEDNNSTNEKDKTDDSIQEEETNDNEDSTDENNSSTNGTVQEPVDQPAKNDQEPTVNPDFETAIVTRIVDGDTIEINLNGKTEDVRLLLVDTPETKHPNLPVQKYGPEASQFAKDTLLGKEVRVEYDGPKRDKYDRLLAYLWIGDKTFNQLLLEKGLARYAYVYDPPYTHQNEFIKAQTKAVNSKINIWSIPGYVTDDGFNSPEPETEPEPEDKPQEPEQEEVYYKNCTAVREAGAAPIREGDPGYGTHLDRDGDGIACE